VAKAGLANTINSSTAARILFMKKMYHEDRSSGRAGIKTGTPPARTGQSVNLEIR
jgi:hypothetical protein